MCATSGSAPFKELTDCLSRMFSMLYFKTFDSYSIALIYYGCNMTAVREIAL